MEFITISTQFIRNFRRTPWLLLALGLLLLALIWILQFKLQMSLTAKYGLVKVLFWQVLQIIPELVTLFVLQLLLLVYHRMLHLTRIRLSFRSIARYYLLLLPPILVSFLLASPFTQTVRFVIDTLTLNRLDQVTFNYYFNQYIIDPYQDRVVIGMYCVLVLLLGYGITTISLVKDIYAQKHHPQAISGPSPTPTPVYPLSMTVYSARGQTALPLSEIGWIEANGHNCLVYHLTSPHKLPKLSLTELETSLDPMQFFRANRSCLINRKFVEGYVHAGNNRYLVNLKDPFHQADISLARSRLVQFRQWLHESINTTEKPA
ncbi:LytTR family DNA-binding domain-containing protein [Larkinella insperata]|uniref:LytTR family DNA-binding domain-containing protein n=1 Tax=Larkinella insperata TaxID=332158 RepID=A0ABW3Q6Y5_9BACT|nr:LytTR family DNA-binding domain-containing protein [Larkinella insperata]